MRSAECGVRNVNASVARRATLHCNSALPIPHSALLRHHRHSFGYAAPPPGSYYCLVRSGIRTDPSQWTDERHRRGIAGEERSEEHTSELQSRLHLVCRLLLEKTINANDAEMRPHFRMRSIALFISIPLLRQAFGRSLS